MRKSHDAGTVCIVSLTKTRCFLEGGIREEGKGWICRVPRYFFVQKKSHMKRRPGRKAFFFFPVIHALSTQTAVWRAASICLSLLWKYDGGCLDDHA